MSQRPYKSYLLFVLTTILALNYMDRWALGLVLQGVKVDLHLSDTQLGLLTGIAFALFYSIMGVPIARWADWGNRVTLISLSTALWSLGVALCGASHSFVQFLLIRVCVGVGEAGCLPPAHSLIADYFTRVERPRAVSIYMLGGPLSVVLGYFAAGWLNQLYGWRTMFVVLGLPGLVVAVLARVTLREPRSRRPEMKQEPGPAHESGGPPQVPPGPVGQNLKEVGVALWCNATFRHLLLGYAVTSFFAYGIAQWQPAFFMRTYGLDSGELGTWFTAIFGLGGTAGAYLGGAWASRRAAQRERLQLAAISIIYAAFGVISVGVYLTSNLYLAFGLMTVAIVGLYAGGGPLFATIQTIVPERMRAMAIALVFLFSNLIGMGLGPLVAGALSDVLRPWAGADSLRYALALLCPGYFLGALYIWRASRTVTDDLGSRMAHENTASADNSIVFGGREI